MQTLTPKVVPTNYSVTWFSVAGKILRWNYPQILLMGIIVVSIQLAGTRGRFVGSILSSVILALLSPGVLMLVSSWVKAQKPDFNKILIVFNDREVFNRVFPYVVFSGALALASSILVMFGMYGLSALLSLAALPFTTFCLPLMVFNNLPLKEALKKSLDGFVQNILPLLLCGVVGVLIALAALIALVLPLVFIAVPMFSLVPYLTYYSVFAGADMNTLDQEWKHRLETELASDIKNA